MAAHLPIYHDQDRMCGGSSNSPAWHLDPQPCQRCNAQDIYSATCYVDHDLRQAGCYQLLCDVEQWGHHFQLQLVALPSSHVACPHPEHVVQTFANRSFVPITHGAAGPSPTQSIRLGCFERQAHESREGLAEAWLREQIQALLHQSCPAMYVEQLIVIQVVASPSMNVHRFLTLSRKAFWSRNHNETQSRCACSEHLASRNSASSCIQSGNTVPKISASQCAELDPRNQSIYDLQVSEIHHQY